MTAKWLFIEQMLLHLVENGIRTELACDIVSRLHIDLPDDLDVSSITDLVTKHTDDILTTMTILRRMLHPLFFNPQSPSYYRLNPTVEMMLGNMVAQMKVGYGSSSSTI